MITLKFGAREPTDSSLPPPQASSHKVPAPISLTAFHTEASVIFQGTKGYVGPKGDEGEAGDPGNDVSNLYKAV